MTQLPPGAIRRVSTHEFEASPQEHYVEPSWCSRALFENEPFHGVIHDPCCGWGRIPREAQKIHLRATGSDLIDRGADFPAVDWLDSNPRRLWHAHDNIVMNPPFHLGREFIETSCRRTRAAWEHGSGKVAALLPMRRLNAAYWLKGEHLLPFRLTKIWFLTPRPSMPPGRVVEELAISLNKEPSGGQQDFCWVVLDSDQMAMYRPPGWLHRTRGRI